MNNNTTATELVDNLAKARHIFVPQELTGSTLFFEELWLLCV